MTRFLKIEDVLRLHARLIDSSGGSPGIRDQGAIESAVAQPQMSFGGEDLYPSLPEKAAALGFSLIRNHAFIDGNKRIGHAAMDEQERVILAVAASEIDRPAFTAWVIEHIAPYLPGH